MNANVVTALKFEEFVLSVLKQICIKENKPIFTCYDVNQYSKDDYNFSYMRNLIVHGHARFDAYMPKGFSIFDCPVIVEIKYNISSSMFDDLMPSNDDHISLYIVGSPKNPKELNNRIKGKNVIIWGEEIISKWKKEYAVDYYGLFSENEPEESFIEFKKKNEANKNLLLHTVQEKNLSLALGAGVSMDFGALKWTDLIESFYAEIQSDNKIDNAKAVQEKIGGTSIINGQFTEDNLKDFMNSLYNGIYSYYNPNNDYHDSTIAHLIPLVTKEQIRFGIEKFKKLDISTKEGKQRLIDGFINAIYLYDDKITFTFNYKDGTKTVFLSELNCTPSGSDLKCLGAPNKRAPLWVLFCLT